MLIRQALGEPDTYLTLLVLGMGSVVLGLVLGPRLGRPAWLVMLAAASVAVIVTLTAIPTGGWDELGRSDGGFSVLASCLGPRSWGDLVATGLAADTLLNVALFVPAGLLWSIVAGHPIRVVAGLALLSLAIEAWQGFSGGRACELDDLRANTVGALIGASAGALAGWIVRRAGVDR